MSTPATVEIWESNGAGETPTHITGLDFGSADIPNMVAADHPLVIPASAVDIFSYTKWTRWKVTAWVDTNTIDNFKWFKSSGSNAPNWTELWQNNANPTYAQPIRAAGQTPQTVWRTSAGTAVAIDGSIANPTLAYSSYAVMQVSVTDTTAAGAKGTHVLTYRYDES